ncbi:UDP-2,3-diacylglucosamine diphosphatase [candidate division WOR-3 bacterium]|nr:UDP-2,3-diacylglucosamine diphosphatase [candidate division WOR-3 bacterium]
MKARNTSRLSLKISSPQDEICFIGDIHFGAEGREKEEAKKKIFSELLHDLAEKKIPVVFVGDIFDFLFDYGKFIEIGNMKILIEIFGYYKKCPESVYVLGNHDFWGRTLIEEGVGMKCCEELELRINGRKFWISHGEAIVKNAAGDKFARFVLRNKASIALFRAIHPKVGLGLAGMISRMSRGRSKKLSFTFDKYIEYAREKWRQDFDHVVIGHLHKPFVFREKGKSLGIIGDWTNHNTVLYFKDGKFRHKILY